MRPILWVTVSRDRKKIIGTFTDLSCGGHDSADMVAIDKIKFKLLAESGGGK